MGGSSEILMFYGLRIVPYIDGRPLTSRRIHYRNEPRNTLASLRDTTLSIEHLLLASKKVRDFYVQALRTEA